MRWLLTILGCAFLLSLGENEDVIIDRLIDEGFDESAFD